MTPSTKANILVGGEVLEVDTIGIYFRAIGYVTAFLPEGFSVVSSRFGDPGGLGLR